MGLQLGFDDRQIGGKQHFRQRMRLERKHRRAGKARGQKESMRADVCTDIQNHIAVLHGVLTMLISYSAYPP
jgi:hypothetical protein